MCGDTTHNFGDTAHVGGNLGGLDWEKEGYGGMLVVIRIGEWEEEGHGPCW